MSQTSLLAVEQRPVFFFDVDDCLYPRSLGVSKLMYDLLQKFVMENLSLSEEETVKLNQEYFEKYTLSVIGLQRFHEIDPMVFNEQNDNALPLDSMLAPDKELRDVIEMFDTSKVKLWLFTNAHITHAQRVVKLLGVDDLFEGITYCDYANGIWPLKPHPEMFAKAEKDAGASAPEQCYFVDDSPRNCNAAIQRGWNVVQIIDPKMPGHEIQPDPPCHQIKSLRELHERFSQFLKSTRENDGTA